MDIRAFDNFHSPVLDAVKDAADRWGDLGMYTIKEAISQRLNRTSAMQTTPDSLPSHTRSDTKSGARFTRRINLRSAKRQHVLLMVHLWGCSFYTTTLFVILVVSVLLQHVWPARWARLSAAEQEWITFLSLQLVSAIFHFCIAAVLLWRGVFVPEECKSL